VTDRTAAGAVLFVDDEDTIRSTATRVLQRAGHRVLVAADAAEAQEIWDRESAGVAVLVTDLELGGIDGATLAGRCRETRPDLHVILTSGYSVEEVRARRVLPGDFRFLPKPFTAAELLGMVHPFLAPGS
jgi:two-component system cell cycle sensor histidine kinase/response regulator CckA